MIAETSGGSAGSTTENRDVRNCDLAQDVPEDEVAEGPDRDDDTVEPEQRDLGRAHQAGSPGGGHGPVESLELTTPRISEDPRSKAVTQKGMIVSSRGESSQPWARPSGAASCADDRREDMPPVEPRGPVLGIAQPGSPAERPAHQRCWPRRSGPSPPACICVQPRRGARQQTPPADLGGTRRRGQRPPPRPAAR